MLGMPDAARAGGSLNFTGCFPDASQLASRGKSGPLIVILEHFQSNPKCPSSTSPNILTLFETYVIMLGMSGVTFGQTQCIEAKNITVLHKCQSVVLDVSDMTEILGEFTMVPRHFVNEQISTAVRRLPPAER